MPETSVKAKRENAKTLRQAEEIILAKTEDMVDDKAREEAAKDKSKMPLSDFIDLLMEEYKQRGQPSYRHLRASRTKFEKFYPGARLCDMDKKFCTDYAEWLKSEPLTPQGKPLAQFWILGIILSAAWQRGYIKNNPWKLLSFQEKIARPESKREFLTLDEVRKLENTPYVKENIRMAFLFACYCGLRVGDVTNLCWKDISVNGGRHFVITAGVDLYTASKMMGHADVRPTQIYAKIIDKKKEEAVSLIDKAF